MEYVTSLKKPGFIYPKLWSNGTLFKQVKWLQEKLNNTNLQEFYTIASTLSWMSLRDMPDPAPGTQWTVPSHKNNPRENSPEITLYFLNGLFKEICLSAQRVFLESWSIYFIK